MPHKAFSNELQRALARTDIDELQRQSRVYYEHFKRGFHEETAENASDIDAVYASSGNDRDKALAYVVLAAANYDDAEYLAYMGAGLLEELLWDPSAELLARIVVEARKTPRFRWLISVPYETAIAQRAWEAIKDLRLTPGNQEAGDIPLPARPYA